MGREIKRVPLDFDWPLHKVWHGFVDANYERCNACTDGSTELYNRFEYAISQLMDTKNIDEILQALTGRRKEFGFWDGGARYAACRKILAASGYPEDWGRCPVCQGSCESAASKARNWQFTKPPLGEGWQLWETVSEGSPVSPVFATPEGLIDWLCEHGNTPEAAKEFVHGNGWAPSAILAGGKLYDGIEGLYATKGMKE